jgi:Ca-activated chloride channel family protein
MIFFEFFYGIYYAIASLIQTRMLNLNFRKMKNIQIIIAMAAMLIVSNLQAHKVSGIVTSSDTNKPIQGVNVVVKDNVFSHTVTDQNGYYEIIARTDAILVFQFAGMITKEVKIAGLSKINVSLDPIEILVVEHEEEIDDHLDMVVMEAEKVCEEASPKGRIFARSKKMAPMSTGMGGVANYRMAQEQFNREGYATIRENGFKKAIESPLSTFSIDVDAASYANVRRFLNNGNRPPKDAVRIEEMINYFNYDYPQPDNGDPFSINTEVNACPWNENNLLLHVGIQGQKLNMEDLPPSNIVFLLDVSGSMSSPNKLPLLKKSFELLLKQLDEEDRVAIVVYAGSSGLVLPSTSGDQKERILQALNNLQAGGSTAGAAGLRLAYKVAAENFIKKGNNRIILATDGDFNVGISSDAEMERLIEKERERGVFMSVLGFGMGNYQDSKMETIADKGNGNYAYIDNILEAKKVLVNEFGGTMFTIAKDVKIQIEFNPAVVASYRLIGYENRLLNNEDFADDKKDAGELGSGHTVTALYEIVPAGSNADNSNTLKYQTANLNNLAKKGNEIATVKFRYKKPDGNKSKLIEETIAYKEKRFDDMSDNFRFSASVAGFGMLLRDSEHKGDLTWDKVIQMAQNAKGRDLEGYRSEMIQLIKLSKAL